MVYVPSRREGDGETERGKRQLSGPGAAKRCWIVCRNRLKIVGFLQISGRGRLLFPVFILEFLTQEAAALAGVSGHILLLAEVSSDVRLVKQKGKKDRAIAQTGECDAKKKCYGEDKSHSARWTGKNGERINVALLQ